jgi:O-antigen/teichoic acid export membrane protein
MTAVLAARGEAIRAKLSSGSMPVLAVRVASQVAGVAVVVAALLLHGAEKTGIFVLTVTISQIAAMPVGTGFGRTLTREISRSDSRSAAATWTSGALATVPLAAVSVGVGAVILGDGVSSMALVLSLAGSTFGLSFLQLKAAEWRGHARPVATSVLEAFVPQVAAFIAIGFGFLGTDAFVIARGVVLVLACVVVARPPSWDLSLRADLASWLSSINSAMIAGTQLLLVRSDLLLIGWILGPEKVAFYAIMQRVAETVIWPTSAHLVGAAPRYAAPASGPSLHAAVMAERRPLRAAQLLSASLAGFALVVALGIGFVRFDMGVALMFLVLGSLVVARYGPETSLLIMRDEVGRVALVGFIGLAINLAVGTVLLRTVGVAGAAFATLASVVAMYVSLRQVALQRIGVTASA